MSGKDKNQSIEPLSSYYVKTGGIISNETMHEYAKLAKKIGDSPAPSETEKVFLQDYLGAVATIQADKLKMKDGLREMDRDLIQLPKMMTNTIKLSELVIKPELFDGQRPRPRRWIQDYNEAILANGWSDEISIKYLPTFLTKSAKDWYFTEVKPFLKPNSRWYQVYEIFIENYLGPADFDSLSKAVENSRQRPGETVSNFIPRLRRLLLRLTPGLPEVNQLHQLKEKIRDEYKQLLAFQNPQTIREFRDCCLKIEAGFPGRREEGSEIRNPARTKMSSGHKLPYRDSKRVSSMDQDKNHTPHKGYQARTGPNRRFGEKNSNKNVSLNRNVPNGDRPQASSTQEIKCYHCGKNGHIAAHCWSKKDQIRRVNAIKKADETQVLTLRQDEARKPPKFKVINEPSHELNLVVGGGKLLEHKIYCNDVEISAVVDTGAFVSVIDESVVQHFGWKPNGPPLSLIGADGKRLDSPATISLDIEFRIGKWTKIKTHTLAVVKNLTAPMLIGLELMRAMKICINVGESKLSFQKEELHKGIRAKKDELIPARTQKVIEGEINSSGTVLEIPRQQSNGLIIANVVSKVIENSVPVVVLNPFKDDLKIKTGVQLAGFELLSAQESEIRKGQIAWAIDDSTDKSIAQVVEINDRANQVIVGEHLDSTEISQLIALLERHLGAFSLHGEIGMTSIHKHKIELEGNVQPITEALRKRAYSQIEETREQVSKLLAEGIIEESSSPWASAYVLAKKKNGEYRLCIDFRKLNAATKKTSLSVAINRGLLKDTVG